MQLTRVIIAFALSFWLGWASGFVCLLWLKHPRRGATLGKKMWDGAKAMLFFFGAIWVFVVLTDFAAVPPGHWLNAVLAVVTLAGFAVALPSIEESKWVIRYMDRRDSPDRTYPKDYDAT